MTAPRNTRPDRFGQTCQVYCSSAVEQLVESVLQSSKYRSVSADLIRRIGAAELGKRRNLKQAVKATKDKLHQVAGAYLDRRIDYAACLQDLEQAAHSPDPGDLRQACARVLGRHASSRERLPIIEQFYTTCLAGLPPVRSVLDVACGLNPLALPWMPLAVGAEYYACDIYTDMIEFINRFLALAGLQDGAEVCDIAEHCPARRVDLALVLKTIPCLEQVDSAAGPRLLGAINAGHLLVSFPAHSLGGARKGMVANYEAHFHELVAGGSWAIQRFEFSSELAFLLSKLQPDGGCG